MKSNVSFYEKILLIAVLPVTVILYRLIVGIQCSDIAGTPDFETLRRASEACFQSDHYNILEVCCAVGLLLVLAILVEIHRLEEE